MENIVLHSCTFKQSIAGDTYYTDIFFIQSSFPPFLSLTVYWPEEGSIATNGGFVHNSSHSVDNKDDMSDVRKAFSGIAQLFVPAKYPVA